jgi:hypothetical protein
MDAKNVFIVLGGCIIAVLLVVSGFARVAGKEKLSTNTIETSTKTPEPAGWYVIEEPVFVTSIIYKFKIARGPKEPSIEAFGVGGFRDEMVGYEFPKKILSVDVKTVEAVFDSMSLSVPVHFLEIKTK